MGTRHELDWFVMAEKQSKSEDPIVIKKYANRRLYNTATATFVTLEDLHGMVKSGVDFLVREAKTGNDITCSILAQIIAEEESRGNNLLPLNYLRQVLSFYDEDMGRYLSSYLEQSMESFTRNHQQIMRQVNEMFGSAGAMQQLNELGRRNLELLQSSLSMFGDRDGKGAAGNGDARGANDAATAADKAAREAEVHGLEAQLAEIQRRLDELNENE